MAESLSEVKLPLGDEVYKARRLFTADEIAEREAAMAKELAGEYMDLGGDVHVMTVLNGAFHFASSLRRKMQAAQRELMTTSDQVGARSYAGTSSSGIIRMTHSHTFPLTGRDVLVVEDVIDSGRTLGWLVQRFASEEPASLRVVSLLRKPEALVTDLGSLSVTVGFDDLPADEFVVGYGLDLNQHGRDLPDIYALLGPVGE